MADIRHLENRHEVIFFCWRWSDSDKMSETGAEWHVDYGDMVRIETRCRIPIWRTVRRIPWHVIPQPPATLQGAATGEFNGMSSKSHISHCRVLPLGEFTVMIPEPHATLQGVLIPSAILKKNRRRHVSCISLFRSSKATVSRADAPRCHAVET